MLHSYHHSSHLASPSHLAQWDRQISSPISTNASRPLNPAHNPSLLPSPTSNPEYPTYPDSARCSVTNMQVDTVVLADFSTTSYYPKPPYKPTNHSSPKRSLPKSTTSSPKQKPPSTLNGPRFNAWRNDSPSCNLDRYKATPPPKQTPPMTS